MNENTGINNKPVGKDSLLKRIFQKQEVLLFCVLIVLWLALGLSNEGFATAGNLLTIIKSLSFYGIIAVGMAFIMITGDADISVGSTAAFGAVFSCWMMLSTKCFGMMNGSTEWLGVVLCVLVTMVVAAVVGFLNAFMVVRLNLPPFIATVATKYSLQGVVMIITNGTPVYPLPETFNVFGKAGIAIGESNLSVFFLILVALMIIAEFLLRRTNFGRNIYATGSNRQAAKLSGINTDKVRFMNYIIVAVLAALSGALNAAYIAQGSTQIGQGWEMIVIASCAVGGIKLSGGGGNMLGVFISLFIINTLYSAIAMLGINTFLQEVVVGVMVIVIVALDVYRSSRKVRA